MWISVYIIGCLLAVTNAYYFYSSRPVNPYCPKIEGIFANPHDCTTFVTCAYGSGCTMDCPKGLRFSPKLGVCDYSYNVPCSNTAPSSSFYLPKCSERKTTMLPVTSNQQQIFFPGESPVNPNQQQILFPGESPSVSSGESSQSSGISFKPTVGTVSHPNQVSIMFPPTGAVSPGIVGPKPVVVSPVSSGTNPCRFRGGNSSEEDDDCDSSEISSEVFDWKTWLDMFNENRHTVPQFTIMPSGRLNPKFRFSSNYGRQNLFTNHIRAPYF